MKKLSLSLCVMTFVIAISGMVRADVILFEDFEDSSGFTIGDVNVGAGYWGLAPLAGTGTFPSQFQQGDSSQSGTIFYGAAVRAYEGSPAGTVTIALPDLSGYTNLKLTVALAANDQYVWENSHRDSLHILAGTTMDPPDVQCNVLPGCMPITGAIDNFLPYPRPGILRSQVYNTVDLHRQFVDFEYTIDSSLKSITFAFASTGSDEVVGIDSVTITGDPIVIPVSIDIKPGSCPNPLNVKSKGVLPVAIIGTIAFDVYDIDLSTLQLKGIAPIREEFEDVATPFNGASIDDCFDCTEQGPDGFVDLVLHFDTEEIVAILGSVSDGSCLEVELLTRA